MVRRLTAAALAATLIFACAAATPARAELIITVLDATASPGGSSTFDVTIKNNGLDPIDLGGFQLELSVDSGSGVQFTDATRSTADTYVFSAAPGADPLNSDPFNPFPNTDFIASDNYFAFPGDQTIGAGETFGLAHISFLVDSGTPFGPVTVTIVTDGTLLTDVSGGETFDYTPVNGTIHVSGAVPEPSTLLLAGIGGGFLLLRLRFGPQGKR